jgi:DNA primase
MPDRYVATMSKAKRKGRIFIDWLRNQRGAATVLTYSARARPGAPMAVPIAWDELGEKKGAHPFLIGDADALVKRVRGVDGSLPIRDCRRFRSFSNQVESPGDSENTVNQKVRAVDPMQPDREPL